MALNYPADAVQAPPARVIELETAHRAFPVIDRRRSDPVVYSYRGLQLADDWAQEERGQT